MILREKIRMVFMINFCIANGTMEVINVCFEGKLHNVLVNFT
jgi:hypothetical protein